MAKLIREDLSDKLKGPSKEDILSSAKERHVGRIVWDLRNHRSGYVEDVVYDENDKLKLKIHFLVHDNINKIDQHELYPLEKEHLRRMKDLEFDDVNKIKDQIVAYQKAAENYKKLIEKSEEIRNS